MSGLRRFPAPTTGVASRPAALARAAARFAALPAPSHAVAVAAAVALAAALSAPAHAGHQMRFGLCLSRVDPERHPVMPGVAANWIVGPETFLSFQSEVSATQSGRQGIGSLTVGPQLGTTDGRVRPYVNVFVGFTAGSFDLAGWANGYSVGAIADMSDRLALWAEVRSVNSGNWEASGHLAQARLGIAFGARAGRASAR